MGIEPLYSYMSRVEIPYKHGRKCGNEFLMSQKGIAKWVYFKINKNNNNSNNNNNNKIKGYNTIIPYNLSIVLKQNVKHTFRQSGEVMVWCIQEGFLIVGFKIQSKPMICCYWLKRTCTTTLHSYK